MATSCGPSSTATRSVSSAPRRTRSSDAWENRAMRDVLLVAATGRELGGHEGLVCGVGPVEAAAATARALALDPARAVLHVGVAGARGLAARSLVIGAE